jgi:hypothetical protein
MPTFPSLNAYYAADVGTFLVADSLAVLGEVAANSSFAIDPNQRDAWVAQIQILQTQLAGIQGTIFLEFNVPRIGTRLDAVLLSGPAICPIEFKVGEPEFLRDHLNQVWDYGLDLKNFHRASHGAPIYPILVATGAAHSDTRFSQSYADGVHPPAKCNSDGLHNLLSSALSSTRGDVINPKAWGDSPYQPTPTIIQAARALYSKHSVEAIARHDAGARNLRQTSSRVEDLIEKARHDQEKLIIFVTGVPGAGKTLVGLNVATKKRDEAQPTHAVFLSGNGPLVKVLTEALTRDEFTRSRKQLPNVRKGDVRQKVKAFIQNIHHFRDAGLRDLGPPCDHVVIFDEAQRAWNLKMTAEFMRRKKGRPNFNQSEPEFLISYLNRHPDWAVVICLVGGGQEINRGEAGISAWLEAVKTSFPSWQVHISPNLTDTEYAAGHALEALSGRANVNTDENLHLSVSMRSFRAENVSAFVKAVLDCEGATAHEILDKVTPRYPIALTRNLDLAKQWIRQHARGTERFGLVASSEAQRLKPHAIDIRVEVDPVLWFLNEPNDTRSSYYLEDAATEFQVQGLELDWVCVTWDADLRFASSGWNYHSFRGSAWQTIHKPDRRQYLRNAYRVLLTRARQGMVIFVPSGDDNDPTRSKALYDSTFSYLSGIGIPVLST